MATKMKGLFKGLRYITQIFDEEKEQEIQIGIPTDVKHVAHIGSDSPATNTPNWMRDFKSQEHDKVQGFSRGNSNKYKNHQGMNQGGAELKELPSFSNKDKPKQKTKRKPKVGSCPNPDGSPTRSTSSDAAASDEAPTQSRHNRSPNDQDPSVRRRHSSISVPGSEVANHLPDGSAPPRKATSRPRKLMESVIGEASMKKSSKGKFENSVDTFKDNI